MGKRETVAKLQQLEVQHRNMMLANRYIKTGKIERLLDLGIPLATAQRLAQAGGYPSADLTRMRDTIRYYRTKSKRRLWLPGDY